MIFIIFDSFQWLVWHQKNRLRPRSSLKSVNIRSVILDVAIYAPRKFKSDKKFLKIVLIHSSKLVFMTWVNLCSGCRNAIVVNDKNSHRRNCVMDTEFVLKRINPANEAQTRKYFREDFACQNISYSIYRRHWLIAIKKFNERKMVSWLYRSYHTWPIQWKTNFFKN